MNATSAASGTTTDTSRQADGRFAKGTHLGTGNLFARQVAAGTVLPYQRLLVEAQERQVAGVCREQLRRHEEERAQEVPAGPTPEPGKRDAAVPRPTRGAGGGAPSTNGANGGATAAL